MEIRRLGPGDDNLIRGLGTDGARTALLHDDRTIFVDAFDGAEVVGFVLGYVLPRRHGRATTLFVYEVGVREKCRRRGIGALLMRRIAAESRAEIGFVFTEPGNEAANALYRSLGGSPSDVIQWDFTYREER